MRKLIHILYILLFSLLSSTAYSQDVKVCISADKPISNKTITICEGTVVNMVMSNCAASPATNISYKWTVVEKPTTTAVTEPAYPPTTNPYTYVARITNNATGAFHEDTIKIRLYPKTYFVINGGITSLIRCENDKTVLQATTGTNLSNYTWSVDGVMLATGSSYTIYKDVPSRKNYTVTAVDQYNCVVSATINVRTMAEPVFDLGTDKAICMGDPVSLQGPTGTYTYLWSTGETTQNIVVNKIGTYWLKVSDYFCSYTDYINIVEAPKPEASAGSDKGICGGGSVELNGQLLSETIAPYTYAWFPTTGLSNSTILNPIASPTTSTKYGLVITDGKGCRDTSYVNVFVSSSLKTSISPTSAFICGGSAVVLSSSTTGGAPYPAPALPYKYQWSPATGLNDATIASPTASPASTTTYTLTVTDAAGCTSSSAVTVSVSDLSVKMVNGSSASICIGSKYILSTTAQGGVTPYSYSWSASAANLSSTTSSSPEASPTAPGVYKYIVTITDGKGCKSKDSLMLTVIDFPVVKIEKPVTELCVGSSVTLLTHTSGGSGSGYTYTWTPASALNLSNPAAPMLIGSTPGVQKIYVTVTDNIGCQGSTDSISITTYAIPSVNLGQGDTTAEAKETVRVEAANAETKDFLFVWTNLTSGEMISTNSLIEVTVSGHYKVEVTNPVTGCKNSATKKITIIPPITLVYVPKFFSPSSSHPDNSVLKVYGEEIDSKEFDFIVFNRWGEIVYRTNNLSDAKTIGWSGQHQRTGSMQNMDTYSYIVKGKFFDGTSFEKTGNATLIR